MGPSGGSGRVLVSGAVRSRIGKKGWGSGREEANQGERGLHLGKESGGEGGLGKESGGGEGLGKGADRLASM